MDAVKPRCFRGVHHDGVTTRQPNPSRELELARASATFPLPVAARFCRRQPPLKRP